MTLNGAIKSGIIGIASGALGTAAVAAPMTYQLDSNHTYPTFEADHLGGLSYWRGKVNSTSGTITMDKEAGTGSVDITMDMTTIDFGHEGLNAHSQRDDFFDTAKFPTATYPGRLTGFQNGLPTAVEGTLTMHGVSQPVTLTINMMKCMQHPMQMREVCGADASATIDRSAFGVTVGGPMFDMDVTLRISIEALVQND
jgi:polyisoprenoid-binding protein YceI